MDNYLKTLQSYFGKKFTVVRFERGEFNIPSPIMACENGDTLFFQGNIVDMQFVDAQYYDSQLANVGAKLKIVGNDTRTTQKKAYTDVFFGCKNLKDGTYSHDMPLNTEWTIKSVSFDTTYVGDFTMFSDSENFRTYDRFKYIIQNKQYGTFECFPNIKDLWIPLSLCSLSFKTLKSLKMLNNIIIHNSTNEKLPDRFMPSLPEAIYDKKNVYDTLKSFSYNNNIKFYYASNDNI